MDTPPRKWIIWLTSDSPTYNQINHNYPWLSMKKWLKCKFQIVYINHYRTEHLAHRRPRVLVITNDKYHSPKIAPRLEKCNPQARGNEAPLAHDVTHTLSRSIPGRLIMDRIIHLLPLSGLLSKLIVKSSARQCLGSGWQRSCKCSGNYARAIINHIFWVNCFWDKQITNFYDYQN